MYIMQLHMHVNYAKFSELKYSVSSLDSLDCQILSHFIQKLLRNAKQPFYF